jgi:hypothetical protein
MHRVPRGSQTTFADTATDQVYGGFHGSDARVEQLAAFCERLVVPGHDEHRRGVGFTLGLWR